MEKLKELREAKKVTQSQLGEYIGAKKSAISLWESGKRQPDQETLVRLASYFDVSVDYLLGLDSTDLTEKAPANGMSDEQMMAKLRTMSVNELHNVMAKILEITMEKRNE